MERNGLKIVVMDGKTAAMDDLGWSDFEKLGELVVYGNTPKDKIVERAAGADAVLTNKVPFFAEQFSALPRLRYVGVLATGYNNVDLKEAASRGVEVTNVPSYGTDSVAQEVFAHILNISNRVQTHAEAVNRGEWRDSMCFCLTPQVELAGKSIGILGFGKIGRKVAEIASAFGMKVVAFSPSRKAGLSEGAVRFVSRDDLFETSDIISLNCLLSSETEKIINAKNLSKMRRGVWIINTGRGRLIDEEALADALKSGKVGAAGLDVLSSEPPSKGNPLIGIPNCFITPHNAWTTFEARRRLLRIAFENLSEWASGLAPKNSIVRTLSVPS